MNVELCSLAMGSKESALAATSALQNSAAQGTWLLIKNVHLDITWLESLEKRLATIRCKSSFRLLLTTESAEKLPVSLLARSRLFMCEPPAGVKDNLMHCLSNMSVSEELKTPAELMRVYFLASWLYAIIRGRLKYLPQGWSKPYGFATADFEFAKDIIISEVKTIAKGRENVAPDRLPWKRLRALLLYTCFGNVIDISDDLKTLQEIIDSLFVADAFSPKFALVDGNQPVYIADGTQQKSFMQWAENLPDTESPTWLRLPPSSESQRLAREMQSIVDRANELRDFMLD